MPNRQSWQIVFYVTTPSGEKDVYRANVKLYFEDEAKSLAYFDANTLDWFDRGDHDKEDQWEAFSDTVTRTLDHYAVLPADVKKKEYRASANGWNGIYAFRKARAE